MSEERIAALEAALKMVTDQVGGLIDQVQQKGFTPAFVCSHSGLHLPIDYAKGWGKSYGIGLGIDVVSEVWDTDYDVAPPDITPDIRRLEQIMHPVRVSRAQVDWAMLPPGTANFAVMDKDDEAGEKRAAIVYKKQLVNPASRLRVMAMAWKGRN